MLCENEAYLISYVYVFVCVCVCVLAWSAHEFYFVIEVALPPTKYRNPKTDKELIVTLISVTI
jgi:hypothetical protein